MRTGSESLSHEQGLCLSQMTVRTFRGSRSLYHPMGRSALCSLVLESPWNAESGLQPFSPTPQWKIYQGDGEGTLQGMEIPCKL